jgi:colanic acid biosynthesis protein WcaH
MSSQSITLKRPLPFEEFKDIYSKVNRLTIELVIRSSKGILLALRNIEPYKGQWYLPGGTVHFRERVEDAVSRIAKEELGIEVEITKLLGYIEYLEVLDNNGFDCPVGLAFLCTAKSDEFKLDDQASDVKYFSKLPQNIIVSQKTFLEKHVGL